jgi:Flp pilus assembly protein TadG
MMMVRRNLRRLARDARGAVIIELAISAPIMALFLVGMVDLGRGFSTKLQLEQASQTAIEKVMNGQAKSGDATIATALQVEAANIAVVPTNQVTVDFWLECDGARQSSYTSVCSSTLIARRYMSVSISKVYTPMFAMRFAGASSDGTYTVTGKTSVRTQ